MHWTTLLVWAGVVAGLGLVMWYDRQRTPRARSAWGVWPEDERRLSVIVRYSRTREADGAGRYLDDRTWTDLNMDDVFRVVDRAESLVGQQVLYDRLRAIGDPARLEAFEDVVSRFQSDPAARASAQSALRRMRHADAADLWWLARPGSFTSEPWHVIFPIIAILMLGAAAATAAYPAAVLLLAGGVIVAVTLRASAAFHLRVAGDAFRQMEPVLSAALALRGVMSPMPTAMKTITMPLDGDLATLGALRRIARWAGRDSSGAAAGELSATVYEYLNFVLSLDGNAVYFGARQLRAHAEALTRVIHAVGEIDAALSVASYRTSTSAWSRPVFTPKGAVHFIGVRHPLLPGAVPATIDLAPPHGVIVTGANMSGKTTFLRTIGVNVILGQAIHTCAAERYEAPWLVVRSCIGRSDDPASGKSYYLVEVESVLALVAAARDSAPHLLLFDELFRGTNTAERIAAGEAVLSTLLDPRPDGSPSPHVVIAATHDQELVGWLRGTYEPYHFADQVGDDGLTFDYQLRPGPARTRNAIALLKLRGAPAELVSRALARVSAVGRYENPSR